MKTSKIFPSLAILTILLSSCGTNLLVGPGIITKIYKSEEKCICNVEFIQSEQNSMNPIQNNYTFDYMPCPKTSQIGDTVQIVFNQTKR